MYARLFWNVSEVGHILDSFMTGLGRFHYNEPLYALHVILQRTVHRLTGKDSIDYSASNEYQNASWFTI